MIITRWSRTRVAAAISILEEWSTTSEPSKKPRSCHPYQTFDHGKSLPQMILKAPENCCSQIKSSQLTRKCHGIGENGVRKSKRNVIPKSNEIKQKTWHIQSMQLLCFSFFSRSIDFYRRVFDPPIRWFVGHEFFGQPRNE